ncbi:MAG: DUF3592 domain-containing protein [Rhodocyclaceae bacterium]|nr:DUF3592 domain-containing protein [Rhodocyclaceae bacterium]
MTMKGQGWTTHGAAIVLALLMLLAAPLAGFAQSDGDAGQGSTSRHPAQRGGGLQLTLEVSPRPLVYGKVHEAGIRVANGTPIDRKVKINALLGEVVQFVGGEQGVRFVAPDQPEQERRITWPVIDVPADETARVSFRFLVSWDVTGDAYLQVDAGTVGDEGPLEVAHLRETPQLPDGSRGFLSQYGAVLISFLLFVVLQIALYRYTRRKGGGLLRALSVVGAVLLIFFAVAGLRNAVEPVLYWQPTTCEVLDVRYAVETHDSSTSSAGSRSQSSRSTTTRLEIPLLTLRFDTPERTIVSTGFRNQSSSTGDMSLLNQFRAGTTTDCYYDPDDPGWVVVTRDVTVTTIVFSLLFALVGVVLGWLGLRRRKG